MAGYYDNVAGSWTCNCGKENTGKFCVKCGAPRPASSASVPPSSEWVCTCGEHNTGKFCIKCGSPRSNAEAQAAQEAAARKAAQEEAARKATEEQARQEAAERKAAQEEAARKVAEEKARQEAAARKAAQEEAARKAAEAQKAQQAASVSSAEASGNNGMMKKAAIGVAVLLVLLGAYFMFGKKKEVPPAPEPAKVETKAETKAGTKSDTEKPADLSAQAEKPMDPAAKAAKLKEYAEMMKAANAEKKHDATTNEKIVFLVDEVKRNGNDLVVVGHFYNGKKNRTITSVKSVQLDIMLRDMDKELLNEKNIKYENAFTGIRIEPLKYSQLVSVDLPGKAPAAEFNNYVVSVHDVHWEAVGK